MSKNNSFELDKSLSNCEQLNNWLFVGPTLLSGIGQVMNKYATLFDSQYITFNDEPPPKDKNVFAFIIPQKQTFETVVKKFNPKSPQIF